MKKKLLLMAMLVIAMICLLAVSASAAEYVDEAGIKYVTNSDGKTAYVKDNRSNFTGGTEAIIKEKITIDGTEYTVTSIGADVFNGVTSLETIYFPPTITEIKGYTFCGCSNLKNVYIDVENLVTLGERGLTTCTNSNGDSGTIKTIKFYPTSEFGKAEPQTIDVANFKNIKTIGAAAAQGFNANKLILGENLESMAKQVFRHSSIESLVIETTKLTYFYHFSFNACTNLKTIEIYSAPVTIENDFFSYCLAVESIKIDLSNCQTVQGSAFEFSTGCQGSGTNTTAIWYNLDGERKVDLSSMKSIGSEAFGTSNLGSAEIIWPQALDNLSDQAFRKANITGLIYLNASEGKTLTVPRWAMDGNSFTTAIFGANVTTIDCYFTSQCTVVCLADSVAVKRSDTFKTNGSTLYCKSLDTTNGVAVSSNVTVVPITSGSAVWSRTCGIYATVQTESGAVKVGTDTHNFEFVDYNNNYCPINVMGDYYCDKCKTTKQEIAVENYQGVAPKLGHDVSELEKILYANGIINVGDTTMGCADCDHTETTVGSANAIIEFKGFSAKIGGSEMLVGYDIDKEAFANYKLVNEDFKLGVAARILSEDGASDELVEVVEGTIQSTANKSIYAEITDTSIVSLVFKITGFSLESHYNLALAMCAFVYDDGEVDYICQNTEGVAGQYDVAYATTFNSEATE